MLKKSTGADDDTDDTDDSGIYLSSFWFIFIYIIYYIYKYGSVNNYPCTKINTPTVIGVIVIGVHTASRNTPHSEP